MFASTLGALNEYLQGLEHYLLIVTAQQLNWHPSLSLVSLVYQLLFCIHIGNV